MAIHPVEEATIRAFVRSEKRDRFITLLGNPKRRRDAVNELNHFDGWDYRFGRSLDSDVDLLEVLRNSGAEDFCHLISNDSSLDGQTRALNDAVRSVEAYSFASILCCNSGQLACFIDEAEAPRRRIVFKKSDRSSQKKL